MKSNSYLCRKLWESEQGVAGVVVGLLFIGLIFSAVAFVQGVYVPQWMEEKEAEHMDTVSNQFSQLKFSADTLAVISKQYSPISNPVTLGSKEMPFLFSQRSYGSLNIIPDECIIIFTDIFDAAYSYTLGAITYSSQNAYFINQDYVYEAGGLILSQDSGDIFVMNPSIYLIDKTDLHFDLIKLTPIGGKLSASGFGTYPVQTRYSDSETVDLIITKSIEIYNSHLGAWDEFFENLFLDLDLKKIEYKIEPTADGNGMEISFLPNVTAHMPYYPEVSLQVTDIDIQISPGWVE